MGVLQDLLTNAPAVTNSVLGLSAFLGAHNNAAASVQTPLAMIKVGNNVAFNAEQIALAMRQTNPTAADTAAAIAADPTKAPSLVGLLEQELNAQSGSIFAHLGQALMLSRLSGGTISPQSALLAGG